MVKKKTTKKPPAKDKAKKQLVRRPVELCADCGAANPFRQQEGLRDIGPFRKAHARCKFCRKVAEIRVETRRTG